jgi:hypothetical protein
MVSLLAFAEERFGVPLLESGSVSLDTARALARYVSAARSRQG